MDTDKLALALYASRPSDGADIEVIVRKNRFATDANGSCWNIADISPNGITQIDGISESSGWKLENGKLVIK